ncbi:MAG: ABC transporter permease [Lachnospiraceae bacterium]|nr:ABC transporter permease [Lachnospiraceae bacterium]MDE6184591.1 ABC transporter permease [Lachnospiraceae bacterium]
MKKKCTLKMVLYELRNLNGNLMPHFFGIIFPNLMCVLLPRTVASGLPTEIRQEVTNSIVLSMAIVIPLSIMFLGYGAVYSQEVERGIPLRMRLFGYEEKSAIMAKVFAHLILLTIAFVIFAVFQMTVTKVSVPAFSSFLCLVVSLYLIGVILLVISHALANLFKRFSVVFGLEMGLYFFIIILCGMMGVKTSALPNVLQKIAAVFPMTYIANEFVDFWQGGAYQFMPFIQSFLFMGAIAGILLIFSLYKDKRAVK